jgi:hypothetical protein
MKLKDTMIFWLARRLPTCKEVTRMASDSMERKLSWRQRLDMRLHLLICALCMRYVKQLQFMHDAVRHHAAEIEKGGAAASALSNETRARIKSSLKA